MTRKCMVFLGCEYLQDIACFSFVLDLANLLNKLHESFVVLAAQLQSVHEAVKVPSMRLPSPQACIVHNV